MATDPVQPRWTLLDIVNQCDSLPYAPDPKLDQLSFLDFVVDDIPVGRIHSSLVPHLTAFNQNVRPVFDITERSISFMPWLSDYDSRSGAIAQMLVKKKGHIFEWIVVTGTCGNRKDITHAHTVCPCGYRTSGEPISTTFHVSPAGETSSMASTPTSMTQQPPKGAPPWPLNVQPVASLVCTPTASISTALSAQDPSLGTFSCGLLAALSQNPLTQDCWTTWLQVAWDLAILQNTLLSRNAWKKPLCLPILP